MSNNKLYTADQVKMMLIKAKIFDGNVSDNFVFIMSEDEILESEIPIELPSDEEIEKASTNTSRLIYDEKTNWELGAKWMRDNLEGLKNLPLGSTLEGGNND